MSRSSVPLWFFLVIIVGLTVRAYLLVMTPGTADVEIWQGHANGVNQLGLINYYRANPEMNHPPLISVCLAWLLRLSAATGVPFRILLRAPFALLDLGTALLLLCALPGERLRYCLAACYFLHPLAIIYSAYQGNTDSAVAFFLVLACLLIARSQPLRAAVSVGLCLWIKLPVVLAIPAFFFAIPGWRSRFQFLAIAGGVGISTYLPGFCWDSGIIVKNVFGYQGQMIQTSEGVPVWGAARIGLSYLAMASHSLQYRFHHLLEFWILHNRWFYLAPILLVSFLRRKHGTFRGLSLTLTAVYSIVYGFSNFWSFQYFAWSLPFWLVAGIGFALPASLLAGSYIYGLYWFVCGNFALLGVWDFVGHPVWPSYLVAFRNLNVLFFFLAAWAFLLASFVPLQGVRKWARS